jgi:hypothetical protein
MFLLGKVVQAVGIADVGYALYVGLSEPNSMGRELMLLCIGLGVFSVGVLIERRGSVQG